MVLVLVIQVALPELAVFPFVLAEESLLVVMLAGFALLMSHSLSWFQEVMSKFKFTLTIATSLVPLLFTLVAITGRGVG